MTDTSPARQNLEYCRRLAASADPDRYACSLRMRKNREALWAAMAFNVETARIIDEVSAPQVGLIRLQWWRDALEKGDVSSNAILAEIGRLAIPHAPLHAMLDHRDDEMTQGMPDSIDDIATYASASARPLLDMAVKLEGAALEGIETDTAPLATAFGLCGMVRSLVFHASHGRSAFPQSLLFDMGLAPEQIDHLHPHPRLNDFVAELAARARGELATTHAQQNAFFAGNIFFQGHARVVRLFLKRFEKAGYDPFSPLVCGPYPFLNLRLLVGLG